MTSKYSREQIKVAVAKICLTIGWHSVQTTAVEILTDILSHYLLQLGKSTSDYANEFGMIEPNLDHLALAFRDFHVNLSELEEYVKYVDFGEPPTSVPKFPIPKEDHLNFLKPGSKEVVTRPVYIHEHLPPMHPVLEASENEAEEKKEEPESQVKSENTSPVFKRPEIATGEPFKRPKLLLEEEGRPTREISSVMMTTSGFLSPAREGKLPESRTPLVSIDPAPQNTNVMPNEPIKRPIKTMKKVEKKRDRVGKELFKPGVDDKIKKMANMKDIVKFKQVKMNNNVGPAAVSNNLLLNNDTKVIQVSNSKLSSGPPSKFNKALEAARLKTEKLNTTITPIPIKSSLLSSSQQSAIQTQQPSKQHSQQQSLSQQSQQHSSQPPPSQHQPQQNTISHRDVHVDKLFTEPDKKKVNILKKISNVKNEKVENKNIKIKDEIKQESRESSPDLVIDEAGSDIVNKVHHLSNDITIELIEPQTQSRKSPEKNERNYFDDDSPPGTPSTPKTPEMITQSPPLQTKEKRKRKDKSKVKKVSKHASPHRMDTDVIDLDLEPPKTPEALHVDIKPNPPLPFSFFPSFSGPGLIPPPLNNPLFPHLPIPPLNMSTFGQPPYIPPVHPGMPMNFMQQIKQEEPSTKPALSHPSSVEKTGSLSTIERDPVIKLEKKGKEHKKEKKEKIKKKNKKDKIKNKAEKRKLKEEKKEKTKKEKKEKRKDKEVRTEIEVASVPKLTLKLGPASPRPDTPETRKLNIKPVVKKDEEPILPDSTDSKREMSPELAKISALVTGQPKPKSNNPNTNISADHIFPTETYSKKPLFKPIPKIRTKEIKKEPHYEVDVYNTPSSYIDAEGNKVWICPACGRQDDGSPMIGCDDCDAWYHWVCVGIQVPPDDNEDWYCRNCINKKQKDLQTKEKKKRKKKEKKDH